MSNDKFQGFIKAVEVFKLFFLTLLNCGALKGNEDFDFLVPVFSEVVFRRSQTFKNLVDNDCAQV